MDAVYDWSRFNTIPMAFTWVRDRMKGKQGESFISELIDAVVRYGNVGTVRRLGYVLASYGISSQKLAKLKRGITATTFSIPLNPNKPKRGSGFLHFSSTRFKA